MDINTRHDLTETHGLITMAGIAWVGFTITTLFPSVVLVVFLVASFVHGALLCERLASKCDQRPVVFSTLLNPAITLLCFVVPWWSVATIGIVVSLSLGFIAWTVSVQTENRDLHETCAKLRAIANARADSRPTITSSAPHPISEVQQILDMQEATPEEKMAEFAARAAEMSRRAGQSGIAS